MPGSGRPSMGCGRCRSLKVKCDESKPSCQRCHKGGYDCLYRDAFECFHREQNTQAKSIAVKKWRARADVKFALPGKPTHRLYQPAYERLCYDFMAPPSSMARIQQKLSESSPDSCLNSAVAALSFANYHGRYKSREVYEASSIYYGQTLQKLGVLLSNPAEMQRDEVLMVVLLLGLYEMFASSSSDGSWAAHMQGTESVLVCREKDTLTHVEDFFVLLCIHLAIYYLQERKAPPSDFDSRIQEISSNYPVKKQLLSLMARAASICADVKEGCTLRSAADSSGSVETDLELLKSAQALDMQFARWAVALPPALTLACQHPMNVENRPNWARELFSISGAPEYMYMYNHPMAASDWNLYRTTRIWLNLSLLELLSKLSFRLSDTQTIKDRVIDLLRTLGSEIAFTLPYSLGLTVDGPEDPTTTDQIRSLRAYMVLWSTNTSFACFMHPLMKDKDGLRRANWFKHMLLFLRDIAGISKVQVSLDEEQQHKAE